MMTALLGFVHLAAALASPAAPALQEPSVTFKLVPNVAAPGAKVTGQVVVKFAEGMHGYQNPPTKDYMIPVTVASATTGVVVKPSYPAGVTRTLMGEEAAVYEGAVTIPVAITAPKKPGKVNVKVKVGYQQCNETSCFPPQSVTLGITLTVKSKASSPK